MNIPIYLISYNNYLYIENMTRQLLAKGVTNIKIIDNNSNNDNKIKLRELSKTCEIIYLNENLGPRIFQFRKQLNLPDKYILSDPDIELNENLPLDFINILNNLSDEYKCYKVGLAIRIDDNDEMYNIKNYHNNKTIIEWEYQFWKNKIANDKYDLYYSQIDTTFVFINEKYRLNENDFPGNSIRIAGDFVCRHLPWYIKDILNDNEKYSMYINATKWSFISKFIISYIEEKYFILKKNNKNVLISKSQTRNLDFWLNNYLNWEQNTFDVFDSLLSSDKCFIDIGAWIGTTCIYSSYESKHVYAIEANKLAFKELKHHVDANCRNVTCINKAIYNESDKKVSFGKNKYLSNARYDDSTSQILEDNSEETIETIETITVKDLISRYNIDINNISLIKVDIEGGEEYILDELLEIHYEYNVPMLISFHYAWWNNKSLNIFKNLSDKNKTKILNDKFVDILFN